MSSSATLQEKIDAFLELLYPYQILELIRTGKVALGRAPKRGCMQRRDAA